MEPLCDLIERHRNKLLAIFKRDGCLRFTGKHALEIVPRIDRIDKRSVKIKDCAFKCHYS